MLLNVDYENNSRAADIDMGLDIQALGGIVLKVSWEGITPCGRPASGTTTTTRASSTAASRARAIGTWMRFWIKSVVTREEALSTYGVKIEGYRGTHLEYWNREFVLHLD